MKSAACVRSHLSYTEHELVFPVLHEITTAAVMDGKRRELPLTFYRGVSHCHAHASPCDTRALLNSFMSVPSSVSENLCGPQTLLLFLFLSFLFSFCVSPAHVCVGDRRPPPHLSCLTLEQTWKSKRACQRDAARSYCWLFM